MGEALALVGEAGEWGDMMRHRLIRKLINLLVSDLIHTSDARILRAGVGCLADVRQCNERLITLSDTMRAWDAELKRFLYQKLYQHYRVVRMSTKAQRVMAELWEEYVTRPSQLPPSTQARIGRLPVERVVADYLAGMTDRYALQEWDRLFNPWERP